MNKMTVVAERIGTTPSRVLATLTILMGPILGLSCSSLVQREAPSEFGWEEEQLQANVGANFEKAASLRDLGVIYLRTGRHKEAVAPLTQSINEDRSDPKTWFYAGLTRELLGDPVQALRIYEQSPHRSGSTLYSHAVNGRIGLLKLDNQRRSLQSMYDERSLPPVNSLRDGTFALFPIVCRGPSSRDTILGLGITDLINFHIDELRDFSAIDTDITELALRLATSADTAPEMSKPETAARALKAGSLLGGTCVLDSNNQMQVDLVFRDLINNTTLTVSASESVNNVLALENTLVDSLIFELGVFAPNRNRNITTVPGGYDAIIAFSQAVELKRKGRWTEAILYLQQALLHSPRLIIAEARIENLSNFILAEATTKKDLLRLLLRLESRMILPELLDARMYGHAWSAGYGVIPGQGSRRLPPGNAGELPAPPTPVRN